MSETTRAEFVEIKTMVDRHEKDLYRGNGKAGLTTRIEVQEQSMAFIRSALSRILWMLGATMMTVLGEIVVKLVR